MTFLRKTSRNKLIFLIISIAMIAVHARLIFACIFGCSLTSVESRHGNKRIYASQHHSSRTMITSKWLTWHLYSSRLNQTRNGDIPKERVYVDGECKPNGTSEDACVDARCPDEMKTFDVLNMSELLAMNRPVPTVYKEFIRKVRGRSKRHTVVIVSATSSERFLETLVFLKNVHEVLFPVLLEYDFQLVIYDLGLTNDQRGQMEDLCMCQIFEFPSEISPGNSFLPIVIAAHLPIARVLLWVDVSLRFKPFNASSLFGLIRKMGVVLTPLNRSLGKGLSKMSTFFDSPCKYHPYRELDANFVGFYNDDFVRKFITEPWLSCNTDSNCMCDKTNQLKYDGEKTVNTKDQLSLNVILVKLFQKKIGMITVPYSFYHAANKEISSSLGRIETLW